jgi:putative transcriptional regulator
VSTERELDVWVGGPVEPQRSWMLVGGTPERPEVSGAMQVADGVYLSTSPALLRRVLEPEPPADVRLVVGYSGWGPGQLERELEESAWLLSDVDAELVFQAPPDQMWERAIRRLGADPSALTMSRGVH